MEKNSLTNPDTAVDRRVPPPFVNQIDRNTINVFPEAQVAGLAPTANSSMKVILETLPSQTEATVCRFLPKETSKASAIM